MATFKKIGFHFLQCFVELAFLCCFLTITAIFLFQEQICKVVVSEITRDMRRPLDYKTLDLTVWSSFPNISVNVHEVKVHDAFKNVHSDQLLFKANKFSLQLNPFDLLKKDKEIKILEFNDGELNLRTNTSGDVNYFIFKESKKEKKETSLHVKINHIEVKNMKVNYLNDESKKRLETNLKSMEFSGDFNNNQFGLSSKGDFVLTQYTSGSVKLINNKAVNVDLTLKVDLDKQAYYLPKSSILVERLPFLCEGIYNPDTVFFSLNSQKLNLSDVVNKLSLDQAKSELERYQGGGEVKFNALIHGKTGEDSPTYVDCDFSVQNGYLIEPIKNTSINRINLSGSYRSNGNSAQDKLRLPVLSFNTSAGPFNANLEITNFIIPAINGMASGSVDLHAANMLFNFHEVEKIQGLANVNSSFDLVVKNKVEVNQFEGSLNLKAVNFKLNKDHRVFSNLNALISLSGDEVSLADGKININKSDLVLSGQAKNIFNYLASKGQLQIDTKIASQNIWVEDLGATTKIDKKTSKGKQFVLPNYLNGNIALEVSNLNYEGHRFETVNTQLKLENRKLLFSNLTLKNANANISGNLSIIEQSPEQFDLSLNGASENVQFAPLFKEWNNFDQSVINSEQISGNAKIMVNMEAPFDLLSGIKLDQVSAKVQVKVTDGQLKNVSSLNDVANSINTNTGRLLLGKKNITAFQSKLTNLKFETLENTLLIKNNTVEIPNMHISSNALDLDLSGKHAFNNMIDYRMGFNFRELISEDRDAAYGTVIDDENGLKVFLRMYGNVDDPEIVWDKTARKEQLREDIQEEKQALKGIIKSEFGGFKNDSTVEKFKPKEVKKETVKLNFNSNQSKKPTTTTSPSVALSESNSKNKKDGGKLKKTLNQWKEDQTQPNVKVTIKKG